MDDLRQYNGWGTVRKLVVCRPTYFAELTISEIARRTVEGGERVDRDKASRDYDGLVAVLESAGVELDWERPLPGHAWQGSTRDFGVNTPAGVLVGKFRYEPRWGDEEPAIEALERIGATIVGRVTRGAVEGGDCWLLDDETLVIGAGNRSTLDGIANASELLSPRGIEVVPVEFDAKWNHLDMVFSVLAEKTALVCLEALPDRFTTLLKDKGWRLLAVTPDTVMTSGVNVLALGRGRIVSFAGNDVVNELLRAEGFTVDEPSLSEHPKMGTGPHCLTFELQRERD